MQLCSLVYVVTVAIAFVVRRTAFVVAATFFFVATIVFSSVFSSVFGIQALALFAATCRMTKVQHEYTTAISRALRTILSESTKPN